MATNGHLTGHELAPVASIGGKTNRLATEAAAAANTFRLYVLESKLGDWYSEGPLGDYRTLAEQQQLWAEYQNGGNIAAYPGTSNHGLGRARDLATPAMRSLCDSHGAVFGWRKTEAPTEWWHINYVGGFHRPDPGIDTKAPVMRHGSGGPGQASFVREIQRRRGIKDDGEFGDHTKRSVEDFQRRHKLKADGSVGKATWRALRGRKGRK